MGFCRSFKKAVKEALLPQLRTAIKDGAAGVAAGVIAGLSNAVADGRISKDEAEGIGKDVLQNMFALSRTAAAILMNGTHEALSQGFNAAELAVDDSAVEELTLEG